MSHVQDHRRETMEETLSSADTYTKQRWIAAQAKLRPERVFASLHRLIDPEWMTEAWRATRKDGAAGVDGLAAKDYGSDLTGSLSDLLGRIKSGRHSAPPALRSCIPKPDGSKRPLGMPAPEDKVAQRAIPMLPEPVCGQDFLPCSYGFRPKRSAHDALHALREGIAGQGHRWVIDADIPKYFDSIDRKHLRSFPDLRIKDGVAGRMAGRWLKAGALESGAVSRSGQGAPQGGVISPLIPNIFLHHVLDKWFETQARPCLRGRCQPVRYADGSVMAFEHDRDGRRVPDVPGRRPGRYGPALHADKTGCVDFRRRETKGHIPDTAFDFLGLAHLWGKSRKGCLVARQRTAKDRLARSIRTVRDWCKTNRHMSSKGQHRHPALVARGHCGYCGLTGNGKRLSQFRTRVIYSWRWALRRRDRKRRLPWDRMNQILARYPLPPAKVVHSIYAR